MIRVLFSSFFLAICFGTVISSSDFYHGRRFVRKTWEEKENYVSTVVFIDLPSFSNVTVVDGDVDVVTDKFAIRYSNIKFYKLSSAYALSYRIDLDANTVQLFLRLGKAQIRGLYQVAELTSPKSSPEEFVLNLYGQLMYMHVTHFAVDNGKVVFGKTDSSRLLHRAVKGEHSNAANTLADDLKNYLNPKLLEAVVAKIYDEVHQKVSLDEVDSQIRSEIAFRKRHDFAARFKKVIVDTFSQVPSKVFNIFHYDFTNFKRMINNFEVTVPSFVSRDMQEFHLDDFETSFAGVEVIAKATFLIRSSLVVFKVVYGDASKAGADNKTFYAEYEFVNGTYELELIAKLDNSTVEFGSLNVRVGAIRVSRTQGLFRDERDTIVHQLKGFLQSYFLKNSYYSFSRYCKGLIAEGQVAHDTFN